MPALMAEPTKRTGDEGERRDTRQRTRMIIDTEERIRRAVEMRKAEIGAETKSDVVNAILVTALAAQLARIDELDRQSGAPPSRPKRSRKKKGGTE